MFCPACGKTIPEDTRFCQFCGVDIAIYDEPDNRQKSITVSHIYSEPKIEEVPALIPPVTDSTEDTPLSRSLQMFCPACGKTIPDDTRFCQFCGTDITIYIEMGEQQESAAVRVISAEPETEAALLINLPVFSETETSAAPQKSEIISVRKSAPDKPKAQKQKKGMKKGIVVLIPLLLIVAAAAFVFLWNGGLYWNMILDSVMPIEQYGYPPPSYPSSETDNPNNTSPDTTTITQPGATEQPTTPAETSTTAPATNPTTPPGNVPTPSGSTPMSDGHGVYTAVSGEQYEGQWKNGKPNGQGTVTWVPSESHVTVSGTFVDGFLHGTVTLIMINENVGTGTFVFEVNMGTAVSQESVTAAESPGWGFTPGGVTYGMSPWTYGGSP
jgi:predicted nucleic acid-binding Zn ribbon protein